jgi:hypothetical protein
MYPNVARTCESMERLLLVPEMNISGIQNVRTSLHPKNRKVTHGGFWSNSQVDKTVQISARAKRCR